jgi:glyoxylase-like metal-dependent hydrolase (beta-lactamase superfamily II)
MWETTSLLLVSGDQAVAIDPGISQPEIEAVQARAANEGTRVVAVVATHADWDHVAGIVSFPDAEASMGPRAAEKVASGEAAAELVREGAALGLGWPGEPRCDRALRIGRAERVGPFTVETMLLAGHTDCGIGLRLRDPDVLIVGDYLSPIEYPFVYHSTAAYRATLSALADVLRHDPPTQVVPGHGAPLTAGEALAIALGDLEYLHALRSATAQTLGDGGAREAVLAAASAVPPPRDLPIDPPEARRNAERQYEELVAC